MSALYVVRFGAGTARRFLARADGQGETASGWRSFVWTRDLGRAEKFGTAAGAREFALTALGHGMWDVGVAPPRGLPTDDLGGTPAAIRMAA